jgi:hypothetical protein
MGFARMVTPRCGDHPQKPTTKKPPGIWRYAQQWGWYKVGAQQDLLATPEPGPEQQLGPWLPACVVELPHTLTPQSKLQ